MKTASKMLTHMKRDPHLAGIRDETALGKLPTDERAAWRALWEDVDAAIAAAARAATQDSNGGK